MSDKRVFFAPGRVNLIGEHTDYNGGHVFPCALTLGTFVEVSDRSDDLIILRSSSFNEGRRFPVKLGELYSALPLDEKAAASFISEHDLPSWTAYPIGVIGVMAGAGYRLTHGAELSYRSDLPSGAGLSSSASIEVVTGYALSRVFGFDMDAAVLAKVSQRAEHVFAGVKCGIMDQFAVACGRSGHAVLLDTGSMVYEHVPLALDGCSIIITNTNVKHSLSSSAYNDRRSECETACGALASATGRKNELLCGFDAADLDSLIKFYSAQGNPGQSEFAADPSRAEIIIKRAKHVLTEDARVKAAAAALKRGDISLFGQLMYESHYSLRDDYEVSCPELDVLVEAARSVDGVLGSRMTGGGFGGCTVSIVRDSAIETFIREVGAIYQSRTGRTADFYTVHAGEGPHELY